MNNKKTALYRHYSHDESLLYVGISLSAVHRLSQHKNSGWAYEISHVEIEYFENRMIAMDAEKNAIKSERPKYNKIHNGKCVVDIPWTHDCDAAIYYCTNQSCDMSDFFGHARLIKKPPKCPACNGKSKFDMIYDDSCYDSSIYV